MGIEPSRTSGQPKPAQDFVNEMASIFEETESALREAAAEMKKYYDAKRRPDDLKVGDLVYLSTKDLSTDRPSKKLDYKQVGPFPIVTKHGRLAYELKLPRSYRIHPVFPAVKLSKAHQDEWDRPRPKVTLKVRDPTTGEFINKTYLLLAGTTSLEGGA